MSTLSISEMKKRIEEFPRRQLIHLPTPIQKMENISRILKGPQIYVKRDDLTGLAFGGNKSRKLEFIIQDALDKKADVIITWAGLQSNWCLQTAAAARKFGIMPILLLFKMYDLPEEYDGNLLLDYILDSDIRIKEAEKGKLVTEEDAYEIIEGLSREALEWGHNPYIAPIGGSKIGGSMVYPLGAISYVNAFVELLEQAKAMKINITCVVHASGSGGTQAGLVVGAKALKNDIRIYGISVAEKKESFEKDVYRIAVDTVKTLKLDLEIGREDIIIFDDYLKEGYGFFDKEIAEVIRQVALEEAVFLEPIYTGKAALALFDLIEKGHLRREDTVVFFHTGGTAALFPAKNKLVDFLPSK